MTRSIFQSEHIPGQPAYRLFLLNIDGRISGPAVPLAANTDEEALYETQDRCRDQNGEVWHGSRRVTVFFKR